MRASIAKRCAALLGLLVLSNTCVSAFVPKKFGQIHVKTNHPVLHRSTDVLYWKAKGNGVRMCADEDVNTKRSRGYALWKRLDTLDAAGLSHAVVGSKRTEGSSAHSNARPLLSSATTLGYVGHAGLLLVSTLIINIIKAVFFTKPPTEEEELLASTGDAPLKQSGMMDRCPWPFIFFHDPKQGLKDSPTWVMICWYCLYRLWKYRIATAGVV